MPSAGKASPNSMPSEVVEAARRGGFSGAQYNHVAMTTSLKHIRLIRHSFEADADILVEDFKPELSYARKVVSCRFDERTHVAAAIFQYVLTAARDDNILLQCNADYAVVYQMAEDAHVEAATSFCKHVGLYAAYPYFRALAAQMSWNAEIPLPPLPSIAALPRVGGSGDDTDSRKRISNEAQNHDARGPSNIRRPIRALRKKENKDMTDDLNNRGPQDASKVNVHETWELRYWCAKFGVSERQLKDAVAAVGTGAAAVAKKLGKK